MKGKTKWKKDLMKSELKKEQLNIIPSYDLLPKDFNEQKDKYIQFFYEIKMKKFQKMMLY